MLPARARDPRRRRHAAVLAAAAVTLPALTLLSLFIGVSDVTPAALLQGGAEGRAAQTLVLSRVPRTVALLLAGSAMGVAGLLMQRLTRNRFVEPSTVGTVESAGLGLLVVTLVAPALPLIGKMGVAAAFALVGTALFLRLLRGVPLRGSLVVPLIGIVLSGVIGAVSTFIAYRYDLLQTHSAWLTGDFSGVVAGRYELLWVVAGLTAVAWLAADRFTVAGMGEEVAVGLGLRYRSVMALGFTVVALVSAAVVVTVGAVPFLGLVVPNVVSLLVGDDVRRTVPWVAAFGAGFVLVCDVLGRVVRYPYEIPLGVVVGVVGGIAFLALLLRERRRDG